MITEQKVVDWNSSVDSAESLSSALSDYESAREAFNRTYPNAAGAPMTLYCSPSVREWLYGMDMIDVSNGLYLFRGNPLIVDADLSSVEYEKMIAYNAHTGVACIEIKWAK